MYHTVLHLIRLIVCGSNVNIAELEYDQDAGQPQTTDTQENK